MKLNLQLYYGSILVGDLNDVIVHQGTWFGHFRQIVASKMGRTEERLCDFIRFCHDFHVRLAEGKDPNAAEFDMYKDVLDSDLWHVPCRDGTVLKIKDGPLFIEGGEVSWILPTSDPSPEKAAYQEWTRLTGMT
jgi:hypothetical protein